MRAAHRELFLVKCGDTSAALHRLARLCSRTAGFSNQKLYKLRELPCTLAGGARIKMDELCVEMGPVSEKDKVNITRGRRRSVRNKKRL